MIRSHYHAGTGAVLVETREERRFLESLVAELDADTEVATLAAPSGRAVCARTGKRLDIQGLDPGLAWASEGDRVLIVYDWHTLVNTPGHWRRLIDALPTLRSPVDAKASPGLVVFVAPAWSLTPENPLRGSIPVLSFAPPDRAALAKIAAGLKDLNGHADGIGDALAGLTAEAAEQAAAECLAARGDWDTAYLRGARKAALREAGLEVWSPVATLGGLSGLKDFAELELFPWVRDPALSVRRVLCAGVPGCLHADTPIYDPVAGDTLTVQERETKGVPFHVWSINERTGAAIVAHAERPYRYPKADLIRLEFRDGASITVTGGHRFWNGETYVSASSICAALRQSGVYRLPKYSSAPPSTPPQGGLHSTHRAGGFRGGYPSEYGSCGGQLLADLGSAQDASPSQGGAQQRGHSGSHWDVRGNKSLHTPSRDCGLLASTDYVCPSVPLLAGVLERPGEAESRARLSFEHARYEQRHSSQAPSHTAVGLPTPNFPGVADYRLDGIPYGNQDALLGSGSRANECTQTTPRSGDGIRQLYNGASSHPSVDPSALGIHPRDSGVQYQGWVEIVKAEPAGRDHYYDFHVPGYENYWAQGCFHHNTGKSFAARWLAHRLGCECVRLSVPALKAGLVGASEANLRRALARIDALAAEAPLVVVLDEIDTIAREGLDGGTSSGMFAELLTWLQESTAQAVVVATLNRLDRLDAALESRFQARFFYDLPTRTERVAVAGIHFERLECADVEKASAALAAYSEGFSSREIAEHIVPSVARRTKRQPDDETIRAACESFTPASKTQAEQLNQMRQAAGSLRRANDPESVNAAPTGRRIKQ